MSPSLVRIGLLALLLPAACAPPATLAPRAAAGARVQLVDSVAWSDDGGEGTLRRVQVRHRSRVDTVPGVLTSDLPVLAAGRVLGFAYQRGDIVGAFAYDLDTRALRRDSLPGDLHPFFSAPAFAPDGRHLAYLVVPGNDSAYAVVRSWPGRQLVWRSAAVRVPATDAAGGGRVRWLSPDTAEVLVETGAVTDQAWYHLLGSVRRRAVLAADTLHVRPRW